MSVSVLGLLLGAFGVFPGRGGGSWGVLWGVRGRLQAILEAVMWQRDFQMFFGSIWETFWAPKGVDNGAQVGPRSDPNRRRKRRCEKKRFKIVLGRSWGGLGAVLERSWAILAELEAILGRFGGGWGGAESLFFLRFFNTC